MNYTANNSLEDVNNSRRKFLSAISTLAAGQLLISIPAISKAAQFSYSKETVTVGQVMDQFIKEVPIGVMKQTVDTLKSGTKDMQITGIVTSMFATIDIIRKTIATGANFIIAHEPTFYNHEDETEWLKDNDVFQYKMQLLKQNRIAVWRCHDYIHELVPDAVTMAVLSQLDWKGYADKTLPNLINIPPVQLKDLIGYIKTKLGIDAVRYIGDLHQNCTKLLLEPGAAGRFKHVGGINQYKPDVLICGEMQEWETAEFVRDARAKGNQIALIVLGHIASEEAGSVFMLDWLKERFPAIKSQFIASGKSLSFI